MYIAKRSHESVTFIHTLWGCLLTLMVLWGISGTLYKLLSPTGWLASLMGQGFSGGVAAIGLMIAFGVVGWVARTWTSTREQAASATFAVYVFASVGVLYSFQLWTKGTI